jgi:hypothetical protein
LPPGYVPPAAGPPKVVFQPEKPKTGLGLTLPPSTPGAAQVAEANRLALTGAAPDPPRAGTAGDVFNAVGALHLNGKPLEGQMMGLVLDPLKRDWHQASTGEKALVITAGVVMAGLAAPALQNKDTVSGFQTVVPRISVPIPLGKDLKLNLSVSTTQPEGGVTLRGSF